MEISGVVSFKKERVIREYIVESVGKRRIEKKVLLYSVIKRILVNLELF